jgi:hypothetical protein
VAPRRGLEREVFVAVGETGTILTSARRRFVDAARSGLHEVLYSVSWDGSRFVASAASAVLTSPDGARWSYRKIGPNQSLRIDRFQRLRVRRRRR